MNLAPPIPRFGRPPTSRARRSKRATRPPAANRTPAKDLTQALQRERHAARLHDPRRRRRAGRDRHPDGLLVVGDEGLPVGGRRHVRRPSVRRSSGPCSGSSRWSAMMRVDYRYLRLVSVPGYVVAARPARPASSSPELQHRRRRLGPLAAARAAAGHPPGRDRQARAGHLPRPLVRQARHEGRRLLGRDDPVPAHRRRRSSPSCSGSRTSGRRSSSR